MKEQTPLLKIRQQAVEYLNFCQKLNDKARGGSNYDLGHINAFTNVIKWIDEILPEERKMVEDFADEYTDAVMGGCNMTAKEWFTQKYGQ